MNPDPKQIAERLRDDAKGARLAADGHPDILETAANMELAADLLSDPERLTLDEVRERLLAEDAFPLLHAAILAQVGEQLLDDEAVETAVEALLAGLDREGWETAFAGPRLRGPWREALQAAIDTLTRGEEEL